MARRRKPRPRPLRGVGIDRTNKESFKNEARWQSDCAVCEKVGGSFHAHHVIYEQHLRDRGLPKWDTRNARRVCPEPCHELHHRGRRRIQTKNLTDDNIAYAFHVLGAYAADYLRRYYDDQARDPRIVAHERELEEAA